MEIPISLLIHVVSRIQLFAAHVPCWLSAEGIYQFLEASRMPIFSTGSCSSILVVPL